MKKLVILALCTLIILSASAMATIECSVVPFDSCSKESVKIIGMTSLANGGSHASIPTDQTNVLVACCTGVEGLSVSYANEDADIYLTAARDAHVSRIEGENGIKINGVSCGYMNSCGVNECVFSISADTNAHISDCGNYAFERKLCCNEGRLDGEELEIVPEESTTSAEPARTITEETIPASPVENMSIPPSSEVQRDTPSARIRKAIPSHIKVFLRNFLRGGIVGNFLRQP